MYALFDENPVLNDGVATFHASHGNLGTAGALSITTLGEGFTLLRLQKAARRRDADRRHPEYLVVPPALETVAARSRATSTRPPRTT